MNCPHCDGDTTVIFEAKDGCLVERMRECKECHERFRTFERVERIENREYKEKWLDEE